MPVPAPVYKANKKFMAKCRVQQIV